MDVVTKNPEILARLELLKDKVIRLERELFPVLHNRMEQTESVADSSNSPAMYLISSIIERVDGITDSLDIN